MDKQPKSLITRFLEIAIIFAIASYLIRLGVCYIVQVWPVLAIIATLILTGILIYRIWKKHNETKW